MSPADPIIISSTSGPGWQSYSSAPTAAPSFERVFPSPFAPGLVVAGDPAGCACDRTKKGKARTGWARCSRIFRRRVRLVTGESAGAETTTGQRLVALLTPGHQARYALASDMKRTPGAQASETLLAMGITQAHRAAVFIPPENLAFWNIAMECRADPFFVPAILGAPMLKGLSPPALKCPSEPYYGFTNYKDAKFRTIERPATLRPGCTLENRTRYSYSRRPATGRKIHCN